MIEEYLKEGKQTRISKTAYEHIKEIKNMITYVPDGTEVFKKAYKTAKYIRRLKVMEDYSTLPNQEKRDLKKKEFRERTAAEILEKGNIQTNSDYGTVFRMLMIAQEIPTTHLETFDRNILMYRKLSSKPFSRIHTYEDTFIIDPANINFYKSEQDMFNKTKHIIFKEGLDSWDIGIRTYDDLLKARDDNIDRLLDRFKRLKRTSQN